MADAHTYALPPDGYPRRPSRPDIRLGSQRSRRRAAAGRRRTPISPALLPDKPYGAVYRLFAASPLSGPNE